MAADEQIAALIETLVDALEESLVADVFAKIWPRLCASYDAKLVRDEIRMAVRPRLRAHLVAKFPRFESEVIHG